MKLYELTPSKSTSLKKTRAFCTYGTHYILALSLAVPARYAAAGANAPMEGPARVIIPADVPASLGPTDNGGQASDPRGMAQAGTELGDLGMLGRDAPPGEWALQTAPHLEAVAAALALPAADAAQAIRRELNVLLRANPSGNPLHAGPAAAAEFFLSALRRPRETATLLQERKKGADLKERQGLERAIQSLEQVAAELSENPEVARTLLGHLESLAHDLSSALRSGDFSGLQEGLAKFDGAAPRPGEPAAEAVDAWRRPPPRTGTQRLAESAEAGLLPPDDAAARSLETGQPRVPSPPILPQTGSANAAEQGRRRFYLMSVEKRVGFGNAWALAHYVFELGLVQAIVPTLVYKATGSALLAVGALVGEFFKGTPFLSLQAHAGLHLAFRFAVNMFQEKKKLLQIPGLLAFQSIRTRKLVIKWALPRGAIYKEHMLLEASQPLAAGPDGQPLREISDPRLYPMKFELKLGDRESPGKWSTFLQDVFDGAHIPKYTVDLWRSSVRQYGKKPPFLRRLWDRAVSAWAILRSIFNRQTKTDSAGHKDKGVEIMISSLDEEGKPVELGAITDGESTKGLLRMTKLWRLASAVRAAFVSLAEEIDELLLLNRLPSIESGVRKRQARRLQAERERREGRIPVSVRTVIERVPTEHPWRDWLRGLLYRPVDRLLGRLIVVYERPSRESPK